MLEIILFCCIFAGTQKVLQYISKLNMSTMAEPLDIFPYVTKFVSKNTNKKMINYCGTKRMAAKCPAVAVPDLESSQIVKILHIHSHTSNQQRSCSSGRYKTVGHCYSCWQSIHQRNPHPEAVSSICKSRVQAICQGKRKSLGPQLKHSHISRDNQGKSAIQIL
jgi:hypothetical protein